MRTEHKLQDSETSHSLITSLARKLWSKPKPSNNQPSWWRRSDIVWGIIDMLVSNIKANKSLGCDGDQYPRRKRLHKSRRLKGVAWHPDKQSTCPCRTVSLNTISTTTVWTWNSWLLPYFVCESAQGFCCFLTVKSGHQPSSTNLLPDCRGRKMAHCPLVSWLQDDKLCCKTSDRSWSNGQLGTLRPLILDSRHL